METRSSTARCQGKVLDATRESHFVAVWTQQLQLALNCWPKPKGKIDFKQKVLACLVDLQLRSLCTWQEERHFCLAGYTALSRVSCPLLHNEVLVGKRNPSCSDRWTNLRFVKKMRLYRRKGVAKLMWKCCMASKSPKTIQKQKGDLSSCDLSTNLIQYGSGGHYFPWWIHYILYCSFYSCLFSGFCLALGFVIFFFLIIAALLPLL